MIHYIFLMILVSLPFVFGGCAATGSMDSKNLGSIKESHEVTDRYETYAIDSNLNYYYYGRELQPDAIMGIMKNYDVQSKFWHQFELTADQLKSWVVWGSRGSDDRCGSSRYTGRYQGAYILDPAGNTVGNWYSKRDWGIFEFPGDSIIIPHPPRNQEGWSYRACN